jgi:hypothetical protein
MDVTQNEFVTVAGTNNDVPYTTNGLPMTDDFDLAVYVKGDRKATAVYDAQLVIDYEEAPTVVVPDVVGQLVTVAEETLAPDLLLAVAGYACSDAYPVVDTVITQDPTAGTTAYVGDTVDVTLSTGACEPGTVVVPPIGECPTVAEATAILTGVGLTVNPANNILEPSAVCAAGLVIRTDPAAGVEVAEDSEVQLVVSTGPVPVVDVDFAWVRVQPNVSVGASTYIIYTVTNSETSPVSGTVTVEGSDDTLFEDDFTLAAGQFTRIVSRWVAPTVPQTVTWTATVTVSGVVVDTDTAATVVK